MSSHSSCMSCEHAAALVSAAFPELQWLDPKKSAYDSLKPPKARARLVVPPLHRIQSKPARRAAAQMLIDQAREDVADMRVERLREGLKARPKPVRRKEQNRIARAAVRGKKKRNDKVFRQREGKVTDNKALDDIYAKAFGDRFRRR